jgi:hypothetical protein
MTRRAEALPGAVLTLVLLSSRINPAAPLSDPVAGVVPPSLHLSTPALYLVLAPLFTLWDGVSMLSMRRLQGFLIGLLILYLVWRTVRGILTRHSWRGWKDWAREAVVLILSLGGLLGFVVLGAVWHRPMLSLGGVPPEHRVVDFHSHTTLSHDVGSTWMRGFDLEANRRWHSRAGFDAVFITDHNIASHESLVASHESRVASRQPRGGSGAPVLCPGIEVSAWGAHVVLLGDTLPVDRGPYSGSLNGLLELLRTSESRYNSLTLASLPEYRRNHWIRLDTLVASGLDGFEIVNAAPKANEISRSDRNRVIGLARSHNLFVAGVSDSHGWGATSMVWNLVPAPSHLAAGDLCGSILHQLSRGFPAVRVIERHRLRPEDWWPSWLTPLGVLWETWHSMGWPLTLSWIGWVWLLWSLPFLLRRRASRVNIARSTASDSPPMDR